MTEQPKTYIEQVAPEPLYRDDIPNTAENVLRWIAVDGLATDVEKVRHLPFRGDAYFEVKQLRWAVAFYRMTGAFNLHLALTALRERDPAAADEVADLIVTAYEDGDSYGEWLWQWTTEHGIDADRVIGEAKADQP